MARKSGQDLSKLGGAASILDGFSRAGTHEPTWGENKAKGKDTGKDTGIGEDTGVDKGMGEDKVKGKDTGEDKGMGENTGVDKETGSAEAGQNKEKAEGTAKHGDKDKGSGDDTDKSSGEGRAKAGQGEHKAKQGEAKRCERLGAASVPPVPASWTRTLEDLAKVEPTAMGVDLDSKLAKFLETIPQAVEKALAPADNVEMSERERLFTEASSKGTFDMRGMVGGWWSKDLKGDKDLAAKYKAIGKQYDKQRAFRAEWANEKAVALKEERYNSVTLLEIDEQDATLEPLSVIAQREGGGKAGEIAALNYAAKCIELSSAGTAFKGRNLIEYNEFTQRYEFMYIKKKWRSSFESRWHRVTVQQLSNDSAAIGEAPAAKDEKIAGKRKDPATPRGKQPKVVEDETAESAAKKKLKKDVDGLWKKCGAIKVRLTVAIANFHTILGNIDGDPLWSWAKGVERSELEAKKEELDKFCLKSNFWHDFYLTDIAAMKKKVDVSDAFDELQRCPQCDELTKALERKSKQLLAMQSAKCAA